MASFTDGKWRQRYCLLWSGLLMFFKHHTQAVKICEYLKAVLPKVKGLSAAATFAVVQKDIPEMVNDEIGPRVMQLPSTCSVTDGIYSTKDFPVPSLVGTHAHTFTLVSDSLAPLAVLGAIDAEEKVQWMKAMDNMFVVE
jgi:hypothetical protein